MDAPPAVCSADLRTAMKREGGALWKYAASFVPKTSLAHCLQACLYMASCLVAYRCICMLSGSSVPIVVVLSGSMEPAMQRGDLLLLVSGQTYRNGDVVVFDINDRETPIVHRIIRTHRRRARPKANPGDPDVWTYPMHATIAADRNGPAEAERRESRRVGWYNVNPGLELLTKGDNNFGHDVPLYAPGQKWLTESDVVGAVRIYIAHLGRITLFLHDYPTIKYILICVLVVVTFTYTE